jgi:hypothetical protein
VALVIVVLGWPPEVALKVLAVRRDKVMVDGLAWHVGIQEKSSLKI